jgi:hypothetical protein
MIFRKEIWLIVLCCALLLGIVVWIEFIKKEQTIKPYALVTTFKGEPATSRAFTWYTASEPDSAMLQVVEGDEPDNWSGGAVMTVAGTSTSIASENGLSGVSHKAEITGLKPGTEYRYRVGDGTKAGWSNAYRFWTEPAETEAFTFINVTDSQGETEADFALWGRTLDSAFSAFPQARFIVHNGDLTENPEDEQAWAYFFKSAANWITAVPLMPVTGNHDEVDKEAWAFVSHFNVPNNGAKKTIEGTTYSYDYGAAHFIMLNTESGIASQTEWLERDLAQTDKPWIIVSMHRGAYGGSMYTKVDEWVELFDKYEVDLVLQGHNHEYSRSYPLRSGELAGDGDSPVRDREGTVYVVTNASGPKFNEKKKDQFYHKVHFQNNKQMFAGVTIDGNALTYRAYDVDGQKLDEFVLLHK